MRKLLSLALLALPSWGATFTWSQPGISLTTPLGNQLTLTSGSGSLTLGFEEVQNITIGTATVAYTGSGREVNIPTSVNYTVNGQPCVTDMELAVNAATQTADFTPVAGRFYCRVSLGISGGGLETAFVAHTFQLYFNQATVGGVLGNTGNVTASFSVQAIPEPSTGWLAGAGLALCLFSMRRRYRRGTAHP